MNRRVLQDMLQKQIDQLADDKLVELLMLSGGKLNEQALQHACRRRVLGSLKGKASLCIREGFKMNDEEFLRS